MSNTAKAEAMPFALNLFSDPTRPSNFCFFAKRACLMLFGIVGSCRFFLINLGMMAEKCAGFFLTSLFIFVCLLTDSVAGSAVCFELDVEQTAAE